MPLLPVTGSVEVAPSILAADYARLENHISEITSVIQVLHLDIMDGHLVPNFGFGPDLIAKIRSPFSQLCFDCHLMITDPQKYAPAFAKAGCDVITFHIESEGDPADTIKIIRDLGCQVGITLKPGTAVGALSKWIEHVDMVLLMSVEPGFGGQSFMPESIARAKALKAMMRDDQRLEIDGGIDVHTAPGVIAAGVDTLVAGSAVFGKTDPIAAIKNIAGIA